MDDVWSSSLPLCSWSPRKKAPHTTMAQFLNMFKSVPLAPVLGAGALIGGAYSVSNYSLITGASGGPAPTSPPMPASRSPPSSARSNTCAGSLPPVCDPRAPRPSLTHPCHAPPRSDPFPRRSTVEGGHAAVVFNRLPPSMGGGMKPAPLAPGMHFILPFIEKATDFETRARHKNFRSSTASRGE